MKRLIQTNIFSKMWLTNSFIVFIINTLNIVLCDESDWIKFVLPCSDSTNIFLEYENTTNTMGKGEYMFEINLTEYEDLPSNKLEIVTNGTAHFEILNNVIASIRKTSNFNTERILIYDFELPDTKNIIPLLVSWEHEMPELISIKYNGLSICTPDLDVWNSIKEEQGAINQEGQSPQCGMKKNGGVTQLLTNAEPTSPGDWPWHAAIFKLDSFGFGQRYQCGGTLVSKLAIVTASHCITSDNGELLNPESIKVILGMYKLNGNTIPLQERQVFSLTKHPGFKPRPQLLNDIAIIRIKVEAQYNVYVQPACLWDADQTEISEMINQFGTVVGWGVNENNVLSNSLQKAQLPVINDITCIKKNPNFYSKYLTDHTFCAGNTNGTSPCNGDSGGGLMFPKNQIWYLRGIVSLSLTKKNSNVCDTSYYVVFTDAAKYVNWIRRYI